jgi:hypothetical protein
LRVLVKAGARHGLIVVWEGGEMQTEAVGYGRRGVHRVSWLRSG